MIKVGGVVGDKDEAGKGPTRHFLDGISGGFKKIVVGLRRARGHNSHLADYKFIYCFSEVFYFFFPYFFSRKGTNMGHLPSFFIENFLDPPLDVYRIYQTPAWNMFAFSLNIYKMNFLVILNRLIAT
jgi:hypothetical protein